MWHLVSGLFCVFSYASAITMSSFKGLQATHRLEAHRPEIQHQ